MAKRTQLPPGTRRRGGRLQVRVYRGYDAATGRRLYATKTVDTLEQAWQAWAELRGQVERQEYVAPARTTVAAYLDEWLEKSAKPNTKPRTHHRYAEIVEHHIKPAIGAVRLDRLTPERVEAMLAGLKGKVADGTRLHVYRTLHRALEVAVRWKRIGRNVCDAVEPPKVDEPQFYVLTAQDVAAILEAVRGERKPPEKPRKRWSAVREKMMADELRRLLPFFVAATHTGMRLGQLLGLKWEDVDFDTGVIWVRRALEKGGAHPVFTSLKNRKAQEVPMTRELAETLRAWRVEQELERAAYGPDYQDFGLVFCQANGRPLNARSLNRNFWPRVKAAAGLPEHVRLHDLRHTFVSRALAAGANVRAVSEIVGHHDPGFTLKRYAHAIRADRQDAVRRLEEYLRRPHTGYG